MLQTDIRRERCLNAACSEPPGREPLGHFLWYHGREEQRMSAGVRKQIQLADQRAHQLERLAAATGTSESALVEEALDLLFRQREACRSKVDPRDTAFVVGTPVAADRVVRSGD